MSNSTTLTKRIIESGIVQAASDRTERWLWDNRAPGLAVRIKPSGRATFVLSYRNAEGRRRKLSIGAYGPFTVDKARSEAFHHIAEIKGVKRSDPAAERKGLRAGLTVAELCDQYLEASRNSIRASTLAMDRSRIEVHIKPLLGNRKVAGITPADIEQLLNQIIEGKTAAVAKRKGRGGRARGGKAVAIRSARMLSVIFKRAVRDGAITANLIDGCEHAAKRLAAFYLSMPEGESRMFRRGAGSLRSDSRPMLRRRCGPICRDGSHWLGCKPLVDLVR